MHKKTLYEKRRFIFWYASPGCKPLFFKKNRRFAPPSTERATTYRPKGEGVGFKKEEKKAPLQRDRTPGWWVVGVPFYHADHSDMWQHKRN